MNDYDVIEKIVGPAGGGVLLFFAVRRWGGQFVTLAVDLINRTLTRRADTNDELRDDIDGLKTEVSKLTINFKLFLNAYNQLARHTRRSGVLIEEELMRDAARDGKDGINPTVKFFLEDMKATPLANELIDTQI